MGGSGFPGRWWSDADLAEHDRQVAEQAWSDGYITRSRAGGWSIAQLASLASDPTWALNPHRTDQEKS